MKILVAPGGPNLDSCRYGKEYYLLKHILQQNDRIIINSYFKKIGDKLSHPNSFVKKPSEELSRNRYYFWSFRQAQKELQSGAYDVYHHLNFHYRFFNPLVLGKQTNNTPVILGPAQPPHTVPDPSKRRIVREFTGVNWSDSFLNKTLPVANWAKENIYNSIRKQLFAQTLLAADKVVVVNQETAGLYSKYVSESKIEVIPYGVVLERFSQGKPSKSSTIVAIGSLFERKGFDILIDAWATIADEFPNTSIDIYGDGPQRTDLKKLVENREITDSVTFHGNVEHKMIRDALSEARAFVHPSRSEGFPHVRLEAMASGCPVIASNVWGTHEMVRDGIDGMVIPTDDISALGSAMRTLLSEPDLANEMGKNAREQAATKFDWEQIAQKWVRIYDETS